MGGTDSQGLLQTHCQRKGFHPLLSSHPARWSSLSCSFPFTSKHLYKVPTGPACLSLILLLANVTLSKLLKLSGLQLLHGKMKMIIQVVSYKELLQGLNELKCT